MRARLWLPLTMTTVVMSPLLAILGAIVSLNNSTFLESYWLDISSKATISVIFLGPGFAALCAWDASRWRPFMLAASRSWLEILGRQLAVVTLATGVTFVLTLLILSAGSAPTVDGPRVDVLMTVVWVTVGYAALGFVAGRFLPRLVAAPAAFAVVWLWVAYTPALQPFWLRNVTGYLGTSCCGMGDELATHALLAPALVAFALLTGAIAVLLWGHRPSAWAGAITLVAVGLFVAARLVADFGADPVVARRGVQQCASQNGMTICAWPEHERELQQGVAVITRTAADLRKIGLVIPSRLREDQTAEGGWSFNLRATSPDTWSTVFATSPLSGLPPSCVNTNGGYWPAGENLPLAAAWLKSVTGRPAAQAADSEGADPAKLTRLRASSDQVQVAWFTQTLAAMSTCEPMP